MYAKKGKKRSQIFRYSICFSRKGTQGLFTDLPWNKTLCTYAAFLHTLFDILHFGLFYPLLLKPAKLFSAAKYNWYNMTFSTDTSQKVYEFEGQSNKRIRGLKCK